MLLGGVFLGVKAIEYTQKFQHHEVPGPHFVVPHGRGNAPAPAPAERDVLLALLLHDRAARPPHDHRHRPAPWLIAAGAARRVLGAVQHAGRHGRAVLALRGHRLDLPLPASLPSREAHAVSGHGSNSGQGHGALGAYFAVFAALMVFTGLTRLGGLPAPRHLEHARRARDRDDQGRHGRAHLHAPALLAEADGDRRRRRASSSSRS